MRRIGTCMTAGVVLLGAMSAAAADPSWYVRKSTWWETLLAGREALVRQERRRDRKGDFARYVSEPVRGGEPARTIRVNVAGAQDLFLFVVGAPGVVRAAATWADPRLVARGGKKTYLCRVKGLKVLEGRHSIHANFESGVFGPLKIAGRQFDHGVHVIPDSGIRVRLAGKYKTFEARIGMDDWVGRGGAVRFVVTDARGAARHELWKLLRRDFHQERPRREIKWVRKDQVLDSDFGPDDPGGLAWRFAKACRRVAPLAEQAAALADQVRSRADLEKVRQVYFRSRDLDDALARARKADFAALRLAVGDLAETFGARYPDGGRYLSRLARLERAIPAVVAATAGGRAADFQRVADLMGKFEALKREALLANPLLDFDRLLLIKRTPDGDPRRPLGRGYGVGEYIGLPRQSSKCNPNIEQPFNWDNEIAILSPPRRGGQLTTVYRSEGRRLITDVDLHWDAAKVLFSMPGSHRKWQIFEMGITGQGLRQLTPANQPDVHNYDGCYLPDGRIAFVSTAPLQGVPCNAGVIVGMLYMMNADGSDIHQVAFEQDHDYCPTVLNDGRLMYLRWDYTDTPHVWNRILFTMNPDGSGQAEYYGSNSYWPNGVFYARPIPGHASKIVGIVTGHHVARVGELVLFDPSRGRHETSGVVQRIPGRGRAVRPDIEDKLTEHSWPKFLHPWPLGDPSTGLGAGKYFIVSSKPTPDSLWGIYLVDVFDNMVLLKELEGHALLEPMVLRPRWRPPVIQRRTERRRDDALVYLADVYAGGGLAGVPRRTVKKLRIFTYHFGYQKIAGITHRVGADGPWEVKRVLGTVPVHPDGSALFRIPARTPVSIQPLDVEGKALQLMRSWMTAMPGETLSCVGCHENRNTAPPNRATMALRVPPAEITPWRGPTRGFSFVREVQPVLDKYCVGCHDGRRRPDGKDIPNLRGDQGAHVVYKGGIPKGEVIRDTPARDLIRKYRGVFPPAYIALRRYVRVGGLESDLHLLAPMEFHADTAELIQMLRRGHNNVRLDEEAWDRLVTWIDLNAPCHGTWRELTHIAAVQRKRRLELRKLYGGVNDDAEQIPAAGRSPVKPVTPPPQARPKARAVACPNWPFGPAEARRRQGLAGSATRTVDLGGGVTMKLTRIPAGSFVMGDANGADDERPLARVDIGRNFWIGTCEVTNRQYRRFDAAHDSRFEHRTSWIFSEYYLGWPLNRPAQPVVRVSWDRATAFCRWLSEKTGQGFSLPTEAQWEYACRAGSARAMSYGNLDADFSRHANLADASIRKLAYDGWRPKSPDLVPRDARFDDGALVTADVGSYRPNAWGLHDMHGNVWEWTRSAYAPYPCRRGDGRNDADSAGRKVVRGGSWYDRPARCRSGARLSYRRYQPVFNVGFRVVCETGPDNPKGAALHAQAPNNSP